jgi:hypothetical protein
MADAGKTSYSLTLKGEGISVSRDVDQSVARAIVELVLGGVQPTIPASKVGERPSPTQANANLARLSLREFG